MTREAEFTGNVSIGGRSYKKGEVAWVRPRDVGALIDTGVCRWVDAPKVKAKQLKAPRIWRMSATDANAEVASEKSDRRLRRWRTEESDNPRGPRKGVLAAIDEQLAALGA